MKHYKGIQLQYETDAAGTHQIPLISAVENTTGDVLELGCGYCSTFLLHELLKDSQRNLVSVDDDSVWQSRFTHMKNNRHSFQTTDRYTWPTTINSFENQMWGVVFVDQGSTKDIGDTARIYSVRRLVNFADYVIAHDADSMPQMQSDDYNWTIFRPSSAGPATYIISKKYDVTKLPLVNI